LPSPPLGQTRGGLLRPEVAQPALKAKLVLEAKALLRPEVAQPALKAKLVLEAKPLLKGKPALGVKPVLKPKPVLELKPVLKGKPVLEVKTVVPARTSTLLPINATSARNVNSMRARIARRKVIRIIVGLMAKTCRRSISARAFGSQTTIAMA